MTPEAQARERVDELLGLAGWVVQDRAAVNLSAARDVAVRELPFATGAPDYTLFVDGRALGTVEAKPAGHSLLGVAEQSSKYRVGLPDGMPAWRTPLPFTCESTGEETWFANHLDPEPRSRPLFAFHRPETLLEWAQEAKPLAQRLRELPPLLTAHLWPAQVQAIRNLERSFAAGQELQPSEALELPCDAEDDCRMCWALHPTNGTQRRGIRDRSGDLSTRRRKVLVLGSGSRAFIPVERPVRHGGRGGSHGWALVPTHWASSQGLGCKCRECRARHRSVVSGSVPELMSWRGQPMPIGYPGWSRFWSCHVADDHHYPPTCHGSWLPAVEAP